MLEEELWARSDSITRALLFWLADSPERYECIQVGYAMVRAISESMPYLWPNYSTTTASSCNPRIVEALLNQSPIMSLEPQNEVWRWFLPKCLRYNTLGDFLSNPMRSGSLYHDETVWNTIAATRLIRYVTLEPSARYESNRLHLTALFTLQTDSITPTFYSMA